MKRIIFVVLVSIITTASADWHMYEVENASTAAYDVYVGTTDYEGGMNIANARKVGTVRSGGVFRLPAPDSTVNPAAPNFTYVLLRPLAPVKGKTRDIRVFFPLHQKGASLPEDKHKKSYTIKAITSHVAAGDDYGLHYSTRQETAQFYTRTLTDAYVGIKIGSDGFARFYSASGKYSHLPATVVISDRGTSPFWLTKRYDYY